MLLKSFSINSEKTGGKQHLNFAGQCAMSMAFSPRNVFQHKSELQGRRAGSNYYLLWRKQFLERRYAHEDHSTITPFD